MCDQNQATPSWLARNNIMAPCPFCGSDDTIVDALAIDSHHWVKCLSCGTKGPVFEQNCPTPAHEYDKENKPYLVTDQLIVGAMTKWNERADLRVKKVVPTYPEVKSQPMHIETERIIQKLKAAAE